MLSNAGKTVCQDALAKEEAKAQFCLQANAQTAASYQPPGLSGPRTADIQPQQQDS